MLRALPHVARPPPPAGSPSATPVAAWDDAWRARLPLGPIEALLSALLPRVHGLFPSPSPSYPSYPEFVPEPEDFKYTTCEPTPVAVPRGTAQIFVRRC